MDLSKFEIEISRHAFIRANQRGISPDLFESTIKGGKILRFGKNHLKFIKKYRKFTVVCVAEVRGEIIKILTIEVKNDCRKTQKMFQLWK